MICKPLPSSCSVLNVCVKVTLTFVIGFGIICAIFATQSCRWYAFNYSDESVQIWGFLPEDKTSVIGIGLFRYQTSTDDQFNQASGPFATRGRLYDPPFVGPDYPWMFSTQICIVVGPILALFGWLTTMIDGSKKFAVFATLFATGVQTIGVVSGMSLCDQSMTCPWLIGSLANALAAFSFLLGWLLSCYGLDTVAEKKQRQITARQQTSNDNDDDVNIEDEDDRPVSTTEIWAHTGHEHAVRDIEEKSHEAS